MEALGPVLLVLSIPLMLRWIPRNSVYGFRIASTLADDSVWYDANARFGRHMFLLGLVMVLLELALPLAIRNHVLIAIGVVGVTYFLVTDWRTANRWRRERDLPGRKFPA
jgi:uncharacterized membrane protein